MSKKKFALGCFATAVITATALIIVFVVIGVDNDDNNSNNASSQHQLEENEALMELQFDASEWETLREHLDANNANFDIINCPSSSASDSVCISTDLHTGSTIIDLVNDGTIDVTVATNPGTADEIEVKPETSYEWYNLSPEIGQCLEGIAVTTAASAAYVEEKFSHNRR